MLALEMGGKLNRAERHFRLNFYCRNCSNVFYTRNGYLARFNTLMTRKAMCRALHTVVYKLLNMQIGYTPDKNSDYGP
ncbi:hypothetical protein CEXT_288941 [Caerostris extrusa]|uniref:Uncharacterized protein n=1 Tax=Caerostris extrusa TaxID=172846 RepID=A0AAV4XXL5_CAEEX|nr:hypothetical protein CEXT_288941 [Caerostris extrusa]